MEENSGECSDLDAKRAEGAAIYGLFWWSLSMRNEIGHSNIKVIGIVSVESQGRKPDYSVFMRYIDEKSWR